MPPEVKVLPSRQVPLSRMRVKLSLNLKGSTVRHIYQYDLNQYQSYDERC